MAKRWPKLAWSTKPTRSRHPVLGQKKRWISLGCGFYIEQFPNATGRYVAMQQDACTPDKLLGDFGSLQAAKRACEEAR